MANFITAHDQQNDHSMGVHGIVKKEKGGKCPFEKVSHHQNPVGKLCMGSNVCIKKCISLPLLKAPIAEQITLCLNCLTKLLIEKCYVNLDRCGSRMHLS